MLSLYITYFYILYNLYEYKYNTYIQVNIFKIYAVCVSLYIHNKYTHTVHTHILSK